MGGIRCIHVRELLMESESKGEGGRRVCGSKRKIINMGVKSIRADKKEEKMSLPTFSNS